MTCDRLRFDTFEGTDRQYAEIRVDTAKTKKGEKRTRPVYLEKSVPALKAWLRDHPKRGREGPLWTHRRAVNGEFAALGNIGLDTVVRRALKQAGIKGKKKILHMFRHTRATELVRNGYHGQVLTKTMGWVNGSNMEAVYIHLMDDDIEDAFKKMAGVEVQREKPKAVITNVECARCQHVNPQGLGHCEECGAPLTQELIMSMHEERQHQEDRIAKQEDMIADLKSKYAELLVEHNENAHQYNKLLMLSQGLAEEHKELQEVTKDLVEKYSSYPEVKEALAQIDILDHFLDHLVDLSDEEALKFLYDIREATKTMPKAKSKKSKKKGKSGGSKK